jgi:hypothetical protein
MFAGCTVILIGTLHPRSETLVLTHDRPSMHSRLDDGTPNGAVGALDMKAGETVAGLGHWEGGMIYESYYLVRHGGREFFLQRADVLNEDDQLFGRFQGRFRLTAEEDRSAWERARTHIANSAQVKIEVSNENLIKTATPTDTLATGYTVTRVPVGRTEVEYEVIASAIRPGFRADSGAAALGYYMSTGRWYACVHRVLASATARHRRSVLPCRRRWP